MAAKIFRFGPFSLDQSRYQLQRMGRNVHLSRSPMDVLLLLLEQHGRLVTREQIAERLWTEPAAVDVVQGINAAVKKIRSALADDPTKPRFIETVIGKGYRFIAEIHETEIAEPVQAATRDAVAPSAPAAVETSPEIVPAAVSSPNFLTTVSHASSALDAPLLTGDLLRKRSRGKMLAQAGLAFCLLLVLVLVWFKLRPQRRPPATQVSANLPAPGDFSQVTTNDSEDRVLAAAISPSGKLLAYVDASGFWLRVLQSGELYRLNGPDQFHAERLEWFSDDLKLVVSGFELRTATSQVWVVKVTGEPPQLHRSDAYGAVPSPNGEQIAFTTLGDTEVWLVGANGGEPKRILSGDSGEVFASLIWSPEGNRLLYQRGHMVSLHQKAPVGSAVWEDNYRWDAESIDIRSGQVVASFKGLRIDSPCFVGKNRLVYVLQGGDQDRNHYIVWDIMTNPVDGSFASSPRKLRSIEASRISQLTASREGALSAVIERSQPHVYLGNLQPQGRTLSGIRRLTYDTRADYPHAWLPDSKGVIFESDRDGMFHLYKQQLDSRHAEMLVSAPGWQVLPQLTPDGKWVMYSWIQGPSSPQLLYRVPLNGGTPEPVPIGGDLDEFRCPLFGRKGCVLRETLGHEQFVFFSLDPVSGRGAELARTAWLPTVLGDWNLSPDGSTAVMVYHDAANRRLRLVPLDQATKNKERELPISGSGKLWGAQWSADSKGWYVASQMLANTSLLFVDLTGHAHTIYQTPFDTWAVPAPDNHKIAFVDQSVDSNVWLWR